MNAVNRSSSMEEFGAPFLAAEWRCLAMLNYEIDPAALRPLAPKGTEVDIWNGTAFASMVGFLFLDARVLGVHVPFHRDFEEINLRFYVRRKAENKWRQGVVFVKEIVPRSAIAWIARRLYNENNVALPTRGVLLRTPHDPASLEAVKYSWDFQGRTEFIELTTRGGPAPFLEGFQEEFISQHYWGCTAQKDGSTIEYRMEHSAWRICHALSSRFSLRRESALRKTVRGSPKQGAGVGLSCGTVESRHRQRSADRLSFSMDGDRSGAPFGWQCGLIVF